MIWLVRRTIPSRAVACCVEDSFLTLMVHEWSDCTILSWRYKYICDINVTSLLLTNSNEHYKQLQKLDTLASGKRYIMPQTWQFKYTTNDTSTWNCVDSVDGVTQLWTNSRMSWTHVAAEEVCGMPLVVPTPSSVVTHGPLYVYTNKLPTSGSGRLPPTRPLGHWVTHVTCMSSWGLLPQRLNTSLQFVNMTYPSNGGFPEGPEVEKSAMFQTCP